MSWTGKGTLRKVVNQYLTYTHNIRLHVRIHITISSITLSNCVYCVCTVSTSVRPTPDVRGRRGPVPEDPRTDGMKDQGTRLPDPGTGRTSSRNNLIKSQLPACLLPEYRTGAHRHLFLDNTSVSCVRP